MAELVGVAEIARMTGLSRQRVNELARCDPDFPAPEAELSAGRIWVRDGVQTWMVARQRPQKGAVMSMVNGVAMVQPSEFGDVQQGSDVLMAGHPFLLDIRDVDLVLGRRCVDFSSGLAYGLRGTVKPIADRVFLIEPPGRRISTAQRRAITDQL